MFPSGRSTVRKYHELLIQRVIGICSESRSGPAMMLRANLARVKDLQNKKSIGPLLLGCSSRRHHLHGLVIIKARYVKVPMKSHVNLVLKPELGNHLLNAFATMWQHFLLPLCML